MAEFIYESKNYQKKTPLLNEQFDNREKAVTSKLKFSTQPSSPFKEMKKK